ncbi:pyridoxal phosphate-dependent aminotransferase [Actinoplanes sp. ATCC 53533]|uniref:pyridoxal phosphate-dependent aminotransferase n=1 Tax=Actinoplanes sp. ATCC 53533 TaxID=1288362 RepID=UPI0018F2896D|nr:pyridoxal phosphate-dependent aminotransferase [Actinoplanes sp. ATCC 53533]
MPNRTLTSMSEYASKAISMRAKSLPDVCNLSIGEPEFGPPEHLVDRVLTDDLTRTTLLDALNRYEYSAGSAELRQAIADWYRRRYGMVVDPDTEIIVTHGGVEAIALALLSVTNDGDPVAITDPSYMLYERSVATLGRRPVSFRRPAADREFEALIGDDASFARDFGAARAVIVNSPENPTGYMLTAEEWGLLGDIATRNDAWIIHDEVYDTMAFDRPHLPARSVEAVGDRAIMINSCSKKFGTPGLRIGWMVARRDLIEVAKKAHDYLYLGVNILFERIALRMLQDPQNEQWFAGNNARLRERRNTAIRTLTPEQGFSWNRAPKGGMFLLPDVAALHDRLPDPLRDAGRSVGAAVASYLIDERQVAVVPGEVYGPSVDRHVRLVLCGDEKTFRLAVERLARPLPAR